jgi:hypothetical protein
VTRLFGLLALLVLAGCCVPLPDDSGLDSGLVCFDRDDDGVITCLGARGDCNDFSANITTTWQGEEVCDGEDDDCDGRIDDGVGFYTDEDGDGYGPEESVHCDKRQGDTREPGDCDDTNPNAHPGAVEVCDGVDNDCGGQVDEGLVGYPDADGDGYGDNDLPECGGGDTLVGGDCDDANALAFPGAVEVCNGADDDCDGESDEPTTRWTDGDGDGWGVEPSVEASPCAAGAAERLGDCDDADASTFPGAPETCEDLLDRNCDGSLGSDDADRDGYSACEDCDDSLWFVFPGAVETCGDGIDEDCDGEVDEDCE